MGIRSCFSECTGCLEDCKQDVYHKTFEVNAFRLCTQETFTYIQVKRNRTRTPQTPLVNLEIYLKASKWPIFNKIMGCYTIYFIIAVSLTTVNLDLLTELEHFDNIIDDMNDTAVPPIQVMDGRHQMYFAEFLNLI